MNQSDSRLCQIRKVTDALWISLADQNNERRLIDDPFLRQRAPIRGHEAFLFQSLRIALDREDGNFRFHPLQNLVSNSF